MADSDAGTSSGNARGGEYQVFLNFHGQDTRDGFTDFLYQDLVENCIHVFMDDEELRVGEQIGGELLRAIDSSQIYIPIFSRNYATSKWCLRELARIVDNTSKSEEKKILPIFYDVEPKDVDLKTPLYRTAIEKHKEEHNEKFLDEEESWEGESWEDALKKVDKIKGWELQKCKSKAKLMKLASKEVLHRLKRKHKIVTQNLVGVDDRAAELWKLLDVHCISDVRLLGLHGMGGVGKTTLAKVIYNKLSSQFGECSAFLDDIREKSKKEGLFWLQKKLLTEIASSGSVETIKDVDDGRERIEQTLGSKKVLIVLDDIDETKQIENLIGQSRLHCGTRIIITTRNTSVLEIIKQRILACEVKKMNSDYAPQIMDYEMKEMDSDHALQLFKSHAFLEDSLEKDFDSLSRDIVSTTGGLPLSLEIIGSLLCGKPKVRWEKILKMLEKIPHKDVQEKLMISYEALDDHLREIFLDIACFFIDVDITNANYMWEACEFHPEIEVLVEMSLIKIKPNNKFWMHDQLRDLGRDIVRRESPKNLGKRSRLWTSEEVLDMVKTEERYEDVEALDLQERGCGSYISISPGRFENLRFLRLSNVCIYEGFIVSLPKLRWISWRSCFQGGSGPSMHSKNLVVLELFDNRFTDDSKVWDLIKMATQLKNLTLVECCGITRTPDLSECQDLERLTFDRCGSLKEIDDSIGKLKCLLDLDITNCGLIERVPDEIGGLVKLERFSLSGCDKVSGLPASIRDLASLRKLDLSYTGITSLPESFENLRCLSDLYLQATEIRKLPNSIEKLTSLCTLNLSRYTAYKIIDQWELPKAIGMLDKLEELYLSYCNQLVGEIPDEIGDLSSLRVLDLCCTGICRVPGTINRLSHLSTLDLTYCHEITKLPELPASLVCLRVQSISLQVVPNLSKLTNLVELVLSDDSRGQDSSNLKHTCDLGWVGRLSKLKKLELCLLNIAAPSMELGLLSLLEDLTLLGLDLQPLEQLPPSLLHLELGNFSSIGPPHSNLKILSNLALCHSRLQEIQLYGFSQLQHLHLEECDLQSLSIPSNLRTLIVTGCPNMIEIQVLGMSASLEELEIIKCRSIGRTVLCGEGGSLKVLDQSESSSSESTYCSPRVLLPNALKKLEKLELAYCENLLEIQVIGTLLSLQRFSIFQCTAMEKLTGISNLKNLRSLSIYLCFKLWVVEGLDKLEFLTQLVVSNCPSLETLLDISNSKISDECNILIEQCRESLDCGKLPISSYHGPFKRYKEMMVQQGAPQSETKKEEAKMEGDVEEPDTELRLQVVEGLVELEFLTLLSVTTCPSLETLLEISNSKIQYECLIQVSHYRKSLNSGGRTTFEPYKRMAQQGVPQSETTKEEAKMEGDAEEPDTELRLQVHPSASSQYHENPASSTTLAAPDDNILPSKPLSKLLPSLGELEGSANEAINLSDNSDGDREALAQLIPQLRKRKRTSPVSPKKQLKTLLDVSVSTAHALLRKSLAIDTPIVLVPLEESPADNVPAMCTSSLELPDTINDVVSSNPIICSPSLPEHDDSNRLALVVYSKPIIITSDTTHAEASTTATPISTAQASSSSPVDISSQTEPQSSPTSALQALNKAKLVLGVNPYNLTLGHIPNSINHDKIKIELSKFLDLSTGGIFRILLGQETFRQLEVLSSQLGDESNEISAVLPQELREKFQKFFEDYYDIFDKYRYHLDQVQKLTHSEDNNAGSSAALTKFNQRVLECTKSLETVMGEITEFDEEETRLMKALQDVRQKREIKLGQQIEVEAKLNFQVSMLQDLKKKEHLRVVDQEVQHRIHKNEHLLQMSNLDLRILSSG